MKRHVPIQLSLPAVGVPAVLGALVLGALVLGACRPDTGAAPTTTSTTTAAPETSTTTTEATTTTTAAPEPVLTDVKLGFNNAEQGVLAPDGTPLLVLVSDGAAKVARGDDPDLVTAGESPRIANPAITAGTTRVVVAWSEGAGDDTVVKAAVSETAGASFGPEQLLGRGGGPSLAASGDEVVAVWHTGAEGEPDGDIVMARLPAGAETWSDPDAVDESAAAPLWASVDLRGTTAVVAWRDDRDGVYSVWTRTSPDLGETWGPEVHAVTAVSGDPDVCLDPDGTIWLGYHGRGSIRLTRSTDGGTNYEPTVVVGDGWFAHLSCDTGVVAVAWEETTAPPKAPEAAKSAGWAIYDTDLQPSARGSAGGPDAVAASVVSAGAGGLDLIWVDAPDAALAGTLRRLALAT